MRWPLVASALLSACLALPAAWADTSRESAPAPPGTIGERDVTVANRAELAISAIHVSPTRTDAWGDDWLGEEMLAPGHTTRLRLGRMRDCAFDFLIIYEDAAREERTAINLCRIRQVSFDGKARRAPTFSPVETRDIVVANQSHRPIQQFFISPADSSQWGDDLLASAISVGARATVAYSGGCTVDVRVVFANRAAEERRGLDLCRQPMLAIEPGWTTLDEVPVPPPA